MKDLNRVILTGRLTRDAETKYGEGGAAGAGTACRPRMMKILITAPGEYTGAALAVGEYYNAEPALCGTDAQNKAFHALLQCYWASGAHSYDAKSFAAFKAYVKRDLGAGAEKYRSLYDDEGGKLDAPAVKWRLKSWACYTKEERRQTLDNLIAEMFQAGVESERFYEILDGMEEKQAGREGGT